MFIYQHRQWSSPDGLPASDLPFIQALCEHCRVGTREHQGHATPSEGMNLASSTEALFVALDVAEMDLALVKFAAGPSNTLGTARHGILPETPQHAFNGSDSRANSLKGAPLRSSSLSSSLAISRCDSRSIQHAGEQPRSPYAAPLRLPDLRRHPVRQAPL